MKLEDAFFQISHRKDLHKTTKEKITTISNNIDTKSPHFLELFPIFISLNSKNIEVFYSLTIAKEFTQLLFGVDSLNKEELTCYKTALLYAFSKRQEKDIDSLLQSIETLQKKKFISKADYVSVKILLDSFVEKNSEEAVILDENSSEKEKFSHKLHKLYSAIDAIAKASGNSDFKEKLESIKQNSANSSFSIGITGVMNAGKSTMLNAILGREILGTSVVPETANLTVIKHSQTEHARVSFWKANEWQEIKEEAKTNDSLREFVTQSEEFFQDSLAEFIDKNGKSVDIPINSLANYTSAKHSDLKCNLVRSVDLFTNLEYVKSGVEIVDTPGIDDPVLQREEITKEYLRECDVLVHLMNASQSATAKDIDFILDAILYQNISRLLIVVTRVDTISKQELSEVINYTKDSIKSQLIKVDKSSLIDSILEKLEFIPLAGKMALLHRTGKAEEAITKGYNLEKTGILEVENYLSEILFGQDNPKTKLIISSTLAKVEQETHKRIADAKRQLESLEKGEENLQKELANLEKEKAETTALMQSFRQDTSALLEELFDFIHSQDNFFINELNYFYNKYLKRVVDNINYKAKNREKLDRDTIKFMVDFGIKDALIDIARDYRYIIQKRSTNTWEDIADNALEFQKQSGFEIVFERAFEDLLKESFIPRFLTKNSSSLIEPIEEVVGKINRRNTDKTEALIEPHITATFNALRMNLLGARDSFKEEFFSVCEHSLHQPFTTIQSQLDANERNMKDSIAQLREGSVDIEDLKEELAKEMSQLTHSLHSMESADDLI